MCVAHKKKNTHRAVTGLRCASASDLGGRGGRLPLGQRVVEGGDDGGGVRHDGLDVLELEVLHGVATVDELVEYLRRGIDEQMG